ncbi:MAG: hypothetical protein ACFFCS_06555 [Candidatus Hodarchaeota archaeon]
MCNSCLCENQAFCSINGFCSEGSCCPKCVFHDSSSECFKNRLSAVEDAMTDFSYVLDKGEDTII